MQGGVTTTLSPVTLQRAALLKSKCMRKARLVTMRFRDPGIELKKQPLKPGNAKKKYEIPHLGSGPEKNKQNTEKIRKWSENDRFRSFSVFFSYFRGPTRTRGGGFRKFYRVSGLKGFFGSIPGSRNHKAKPPTGLSPTVWEFSNNP